MKRICWAILLTLALILVAAPVLLADARNDLRIDTVRDEDRNVTYVLKNLGDRTIEADIEVTKNCTGNERKPTVRTYWVNPGKSTKIGRAWRETSCRRDYRIVRAVHH